MSQITEESRTMKRISTRILALMIALQATGLAAQQTEPADAGGPTEQQRLTLDELRAFSDVFNQLRNSFVEPIDDRTLLQAAIRGMLTELDPHSDYLLADAYEALNSASSSRYVGIGVRLRIDDNSIVVNEVFPGGPADKAGLASGDAIVSVEGEPVVDGETGTSIERLNGEPDSEVNITVRSPEGEERMVTLKREYVSSPTHRFQWLERGWGHFRLERFQAETGVQMREAIESMTAQGETFRGIVIDLRDNPGGMMQPAIEIADGFLDSGLIVTTSGRNSAMKMQFEANEGQWLPDVPVVILVDRGSASASEVLAGALQDHGRALVVGERTFGKGSVQSVLPLRNGGAIKLTTALYYTPSGRSIQARGIQPDIEVTVNAPERSGDDRSREAELERHLETTEGSSIETAPMAKLDIAFPREEILAVLEAAELIVAPKTD